MLEGLLFDYADTMITIAIISTIFLTGRWSWRLCSELPNLYDSHMNMSLPSSKHEFYYKEFNDWILDVRKQIVMSVRQKIAPDDEEDRTISLRSSFKNGK